MIDHQEQLDLLSCVDGLGRPVQIRSQDGNLIKAYEIKPHALDYIEALQEALKNDNLETKSNHIQLGNWKTLQNHLLPMLATYREMQELIFEVLKLLVLLTLPPDLNRMRDSTAYISHLQRYKDSFMRQDMITILVLLISTPLSKTGHIRTKKESELLELLLTLIKNLLLVPDVTRSLSSNDAHLYVLNDEFIISLHKEKFIDAILLMGNNISDQTNRIFNLLLLEIIYLIFNKQDPILLALNPMNECDSNSRSYINKKSLNPTLDDGEKVDLNSNLGKIEIEKIDSNSKIKDLSIASYQEPTNKNSILTKKLELINKNETQRPYKIKSEAGIRHSRFGGSFTTVFHRLNLDRSYSTESSRNSLIKVYNSPIQRVIQGQSYFEKEDGQKMSIIGRRNLKNHLQPSCHSSSSTNPKLIQIIHKFSKDIIDHCFNPFMRTIKNDIDAQSSRLMAPDYENYIWAIGFFTSFHLSIHSNLTPSSSDSIFNPIPLDGIFEDSIFFMVINYIDRYTLEKNYYKLAIFIRILNQLLFVLNRWYKIEKNDKSLLKKSETILLRLIYNPETILDRLIKLTRPSHPDQYPKMLSFDLVQSVYLFLSLLAEMASDMKKFVQLKKISTKILKNSAIKKKKKKEYWTEDDSICHDLGDLDKSKKDEDGLSLFVSDEENEERLEWDEESENSDVEEQNLAIEREQYFDYENYLSFYTHPHCIKFYMNILGNYNENTENTNEAVIYLLQQIVEKHKVKAIFYQISYLRTMVRILNGKENRKDWDQIRVFSKQVVASLLNSFQKSPVPFGLSLLFSKSRMEAQELEKIGVEEKESSILGLEMKKNISISNHGPDIQYGSIREVDKKRKTSSEDSKSNKNVDHQFTKKAEKKEKEKEKRIWTTIEDEEIKTIYDDFKETVSGKDSTINIFDVIVSLSDHVQNITAAEVYDRLIELGLDQIKTMPRPIEISMLQLGANGSENDSENDKNGEKEKKYDSFLDLEDQVQPPRKRQRLKKNDIESISP